VVSTCSADLPAAWAIVREATMGHNIPLSARNVRRTCRGAGGPLFTARKEGLGLVGGFPFAKPVADASYDPADYSADRGEAAVCIIA